jgi:urease accessory protein
VTRPLRFFIFCLLLFSPELLWAHTPIKNVASFYNGFLHPFLVPAHLLTVLALGFLFGQQGANAMQSAILTFLGATISGLVLMGGFGVVLDIEALLLLLSVVLGLLVAFARDFPPVVYWILAAVAGLMLGLDSVQDAYSGKQKLSALAGSGVGIYLGLLYATVFAQLFQKWHWQQIAIRILGSWIAASALLTLTLILAPRPAAAKPAQPAPKQASNSPLARRGAI